MLCLQGRTPLDVAESCEQWGKTEVANLLKGTSSSSIVTMWLVCCDALGLWVSGDEIIIHDVCICGCVCM